MDRTYLRDPLSRIGLLEGTRRVHRYAVHGPWNGVLVKAAQKVLRNPPLGTVVNDWSAGLEPGEAARRIDRTGFAPIPRVPPELVAEIVARSHPTEALRNEHGPGTPIHCLANDRHVVAAVRSYLGVEPRIIESRLWWTDAGHGDMGCFHFDVGDLRYVSLFGYFSDVPDEPGAHAVIEGTHRKSLRELWRMRVPDDVARSRYDGQVRVITGEAGTAWFESTLALHRRMAGGPPRLLLNVLYGMRRSPRQR